MTSSSVCYFYTIGHMSYLFQLYALPVIHKTVAICCVDEESNIVSITNNRLALGVWDEPHLFDFVFV